MSGGILSIMILQNLMSFDTYYAIPLSQMIGFGGSLMSVVLKIPLRHPTKDKPLIDYDLLTYVLAPILGGTTIGVIFYIILPN